MKSHFIVLYINQMIILFSDAHIDGLLQDCSISTAITLEILQSYNKPSICINQPQWVRLIVFTVDTWLFKYSCCYQFKLSAFFRLWSERWRRNKWDLSCMRYVSACRRCCGTAWTELGQSPKSHPKLRLQRWLPNMGPVLSHPCLRSPRSPRSRVLALALAKYNRGVIVIIAHRCPPQLRGVAANWSLSTAWAGAR